jgi:hypothetical protein
MKSKRPCESCPYREKFRCTLLKLRFAQNEGPKKCYATEDRSYDEFLRDIVETIKRPVKAKTLSKRLGIPITVSSSILVELRKRGYLTSEGGRPRIYYPQRIPTIDELYPVLKRFYYASRIRVVFHE